MSDIRPVLSGISLEFIGDVIGMVFTIEQDVLFLDASDFESGFLYHHNDFSLVDFVFLSEVDYLCWS